MARSSSGMEPCYPNSRSQCNRQPFLSESGCDRGSVDIHQFDDLPYCGPINPTEPKIPKEVVDVPVSVPLPSFSCSCFNMEIKPKFQYNGKREFVASASFKAIGDCCEGNYETNLDLQIPCPVYGNGDKKIRMSIGYGESKSYFSSTYMSVNSSSCEIKVKDIDVNLNIPCPISYAEVEKYNPPVRLGPGVKIFWGGEEIPEYELTFTYMMVSPISLVNKAWIITSKAAPIYFVIEEQSLFHKPGWYVADLGLGLLTQNGYGLGLFTDPTIFDAKNIIVVNWIPNGNRVSYKGAQDGKEQGQLEIGISYGKDFKGGAAKVVTAGSSKCNIEIQSPTINLNIPCPVTGSKKETKTIRTKAIYVETPKTDEASFINIDPDGCKIEVLSPEIEVNVPCPVSGQNETKKISVKSVYSENKDPDEASFINVDPKECKIEVLSPEITVNIPCDIMPGRLKMLPSTTGIGGLSINEIKYDPEKCERDIEFHVDFPGEDNIIEIIRRRFKIFDDCKDVVTENTYDTQIHALKQKLTNVCTGKSRWVVFTYAQKHTGSC